MNPAEAMKLAALIRRIRDERKVSVIMIEHVMPAVMSLSDRVVVLDHGKKIAEGTAGARWSSDPLGHRGLPRQGPPGDHRVSEPLLARRRDRRLLRRRPGPLRPQPRGPRGRDRDAPRLERRRQDHHAAGDLRGSARRAPATSASGAESLAAPARRRARRARDRARARGPRALDASSPCARTSSSAPTTRAPARRCAEPREGVRDVPAPARAERPARGQPLRRRAADVRHRAGAHERADAPHARRAEPRALARCSSIR